MSERRRLDPALHPAPRHHDRARRRAALEDLVPADEAPAVARDVRSDPCGEPPLKLPGAREALRLHECAGPGAVLPLARRALVAADVEVRAGEDVADLVDDVAEEPHRALVEVDDLGIDPPAVAHLELRARVAELGIRGDRRDGVAG